jgi:hypothetical protein
MLGKVEHENRQKITPVRVCTGRKDYTQHQSDERLRSAQQIRKPREVLKRVMGDYAALNRSGSRERY